MEEDVHALHPSFSMKREVSYNDHSTLDYSALKASPAKHLSVDQMPLN